MTSVLCFGELLWDVFGENEKMGGAPYNVAAISSLLGMNSSLITALGKDGSGEALLTLASEKVKMIVQRNSYPTGRVDVTLLNGNPEFRIMEDTAYDYIDLSDAAVQSCKKADYFCFGSLAQRKRVSRETLYSLLKLAKGVKVYDMNYRESIRDWKMIFSESVSAADVLKLNADEFAMLQELQGVEDGSELLKKHNLKYVFITKGDKGAEMFSHKGRYMCFSPRVDAVDTTGCGDAFTAAVVHAMSLGYDEQKMLDYACGVATQIAKVKGAVPEVL
ncbi:carbohydrate kinase [Candidatus Woesearchaeota archaeon]|nr:carbohydrate kinase [Candidatus Woesearchaeota archaeon]